MADRGFGLPGSVVGMRQEQSRSSRFGFPGAPIQHAPAQQAPTVADQDAAQAPPKLEDILPGWGGRFPGTVAMMEQFKLLKQQQAEVNVTYTDRFNSWLMQGGLNRAMSENCLVKGGIAFGGGWALGGMLGAFLAPFDTVGGLRVSENATAKETAVATLRQTSSKAANLGKAFASIGGVYATTECAIETYRAKSDINNSLYAGCLTGGYLARSAGGVGVVGGCAGFAAWSAAMDSFMHSSAGEGLMGGGGGGGHGAKLTTPVSSSPPGSTVATG